MDDEITAVSIVAVHVTPKESGVFFMLELMIIHVFSQTCVKT